MAADDEWNVEEAIRVMMTGHLKAIKPEVLRTLALRVADMSLHEPTFLTGDPRSNLLDRLKAFGHRDPINLANFNLWSVRDIMIRKLPLFDVNGFDVHDRIIIYCAFLEPEDLALLEGKEVLLRFAFHKQLSTSLMSWSDTTDILDALQSKVFNDLEKRRNEHFQLWRTKILNQWRDLPSTEVIFASDYAREVVTPLLEEYEKLRQLLNDRLYVVKLPQMLVRAFLGHTDGLFISIAPLIESFEYIRGLVAGLSFISEMNEEALPDGYEELTQLVRPSEVLHSIVLDAAKRYREIIDFHLIFYTQRDTPLMIGAKSMPHYDPFLVDKIGDGKNYLLKEKAYLHVLLD